MPKYGPEMVAEEEKWQAEDDARTLMRSEEVRKDSKRHKKAQEAADRMLKEKISEAESLSKVAKGEMDYPAMPKEK
jgi:hypothetical protein